MSVHACMHAYVRVRAYIKRERKRGRVCAREREREREQERERERERPTVSWYGQNSLSSYFIPSDPVSDSYNIGSVICSHFKASFT